MANQDASFGLRPVRMLNGSPFSNAQNRYRIASGATGAIYQGDLVRLVTGGGIVRYTSGDTARVVVLEGRLFGRRVRVEAPVEDASNVAGVARGETNNAAASHKANEVALINGTRSAGSDAVAVLCVRERRAVQHTDRTKTKGGILVCH